MIHIVRNRRFKLHGFARLRVHKAQAVSVQRLARQPFHCVFGHIGAGMARVAIHRIARERVVGFAHVHADLVGAAGFQRAFDIAVCRIALQHFHMRDRLFAAEFHHRHFQAVVRVASD